MQAVILAGGLGTRLHPLTHAVPKVLVPVAGKPFIDWLIASLPKNLFAEVLLLTGHLGDQVSDHCGAGERYGIGIRYSREPEPLGTAGAVRHAADMLDETFVLLNGDTFIQLDYDALLQSHRTAGTTATMVVAPAYDPAIPCNLRMDAEGRIVRYAKKQRDPELNGIDAGVAVFERNVVNHIPVDDPSGLENEVYPALISAGELVSHVSMNPYYDMGTVQGLRRLARILGD